MGHLLDSFSSTITRWPAWTLAALALITIALGLGITQLADQAGNEAFLPPDSEVTIALEEIERGFPDSAGLSATTVLFRGDAMTPEGLAQIDRTLEAITGDPTVQVRLAVTDPIASPTIPLAAVLGTDDFASLSQAEIDGALQLIETQPELAAVSEGLTQLVGVDEDGDPLAIARVRLRQLEDLNALAEAELIARDLVEEVDGPLDARALSGATLDEEQDDATQSSMNTLMVVALGVIAALLFVFMRSPTDLGLAVLGLVVAIVWTLGAQGWIGPNGLDLIGAPNTITTMVPIMLIGLAVDYAIQTTSLYREQRAGGHSVVEAARHGLRHVVVPLLLAAVTTVVSFLTNLNSPIPANGDFGVVAGLGVAFGLIVMLTLLPSARILLDRRREAKRTLPPARPISDAVPGAGRAFETVGRVLANQPVPVLTGVAIVTIVLGIAATRIETAFDSRDFLPSGGESLEDLETLEAAFGGQTEVVNVLIEGEITDDRFIRNILDLSLAFEDDLRRPRGAVGPIEASLGTLFQDWITDDGTPGDNYDPELVALAQEADLGITVDPAGVQAVLDRLEENDPSGFAAVAVEDPNGEDVLLAQFTAVTGDQDLTAGMVEDIEGLWFGDDAQITATSGDITGLEITTAMTDSQTDGIIATIVAALAILFLFFGITDRKPALAAIAVGPIALVLVWVLGTMSLLNIPYSVVTALITALSIGIGVDYTIHIIHRFTEEQAKRGDIAEATRVTLATTGSALLGSALSTALGFGVLVFSPLTPFLQFGLVTGITITYALLASMVVVPPILIVRALYEEWRTSRAAAAYAAAAAAAEGS